MTDMSRRSVLKAALAAGGAAALVSATGLPAKASRPTTLRFPGDPGVNNIYYGEAREGGDPTDRETFCGHVMGVFRSYQGPLPNYSNSISVCQRDLAAGRLPLHSTKVFGTWLDNANGVYDASFWTPLMAGLGALNGPVWLCAHHEPWDDRTGGKSGLNLGTADDYVAMHRHLMQIKPANVAITPILQSAPFNTTVGGSANVLDWFAADACDLAGLDSYNQWYVGAPDTAWHTVEDVTSVFPVLATLGKPMAWPEWGVRTDPRTPGKAAQWMTDARTWAKSNHLVAMSFFDSSLNSPHGPWTLDGERLDAFKASLLTTGNKFLIPGTH